jgi:hypothetical protein
MMYASLECCETRNAFKRMIRDYISKEAFG